MKTTDKILIILGVFMLLFITAVLWIFVRIGNEPAVLVGGVTAAVVGEIIALLQIRREKEKRK